MDKRWGLLFRSNNKLDGYKEHLIRHWRSAETLCNCDPVLFKTRQQARDSRDQEYGYLRNRPDLKTEPHGWRMPLVVKVVPFYQYER